MIYRILTSLNRAKAHPKPKRFPFDHPELNQLVKMCRPGFKPSNLIEQAMQGGYYCTPDRPAKIFETSLFMCNALGKLHRSLDYLEAEDEAVTRAIFLLLRAINPATQSGTLQAALYSTFSKQKFWPIEQRIAYRFQLYCWFVFDLKRKGL